MTTETTHCHTLPVVPIGGLGGSSSIQWNYVIHLVMEIMERGTFLRSFLKETTHCQARKITFIFEQNLKI